MKGLVVCPQPRAADVGAAILNQGGTAFDAAIATAFAQMIVDPFMCGIGGMGSFQYYHSATGENGMIDFHATSGSKVTPEMWQNDMKGSTPISGYSLFDDYRSELGYTSIMTPGTVAGFAEAHRRFGTMPWCDLLQPAICMAREGFQMTSYVRDFFTRDFMEGIPDGMTRVTKTNACREIYVHPEGRFHDIGEIVKNPGYADSLDALATDGPESFYTGALGKKIADDLAANGSYVTAKDLANFKPNCCAPVKGSYRGHPVSSNPPPGSGISLIQMLQILEHFDLGSYDHGSAPHLDLVARAMSAAHRDRNEYLADPAFTEVPAEMLTSRDRAAMWAEKIRKGEFLGDGKESPPSCTTHLSVYDETGNAVSCTHTLGTGSGVVTPGTGFVYNNSMKLFDPIPGRANSMAPGKRRTTGMVPTILFHEDGKPRIIVGAPGGSVIISSVLQTILNIVDFGMSPIEAVTVPRIHCEGKGIHAEARVQSSEINKLRDYGHMVDHTPTSFDPVMSRAHAITVERDGTYRGGADPRGGGGVAYSR